MAQFVDVSQALRSTYNKKIEDARVEGVVATELFDWDSDLKIGANNVFNVPLITSQSQGSHIAAVGDTSTPENPIAPGFAMAQVAANETTEILQISFGSLAQADQGATASFVSIESLKMLAQYEAARRSLEWTFLYGGTPVGTVSAVTPSGGTATITLTAGSASTGYLVGNENLRLDAYTSGGAKHNTNATIVLTGVVFGSNGLVSQITVSGNSSDMSAIAVGDNLWRRNAFGAEAPGIWTCATTVSGSFQGLNRSNLSALQPNYFTAVGVLSYERLLKQIAFARLKGLTGKAYFMASPSVMTALINDAANSSRRMDASYSATKTKVGTAALEIVTGGVTVTCTEVPFMRDSDGLLIGEDNVLRPCVTKLVDNLGGEALNQMSATSNVFTFKLFASGGQTLVKPARAVALNGITVP